MSKQLLHYKGLFGEDADPFKRFEIHHETLVSRSILYNFEIQEHLHTDLVQFFFVTSGGGLLLSAGRRIRLESPCALIIPANTLHGFAFQSEVEGDVFTMSEGVFEQFLNQGKPFFSGFDQLSYFTLDADNASFSELISLKDQLIKEMSSVEASAILALPLLFQLFMLGIYRSPKGKSEISEKWKGDRKTLSHFQSFKRLLREHIPEERSVSFYAESLKLSKVHLNRICQATVQRTALAVIHDQIMSEARKFLSGSSYTVSEIAYLLGFKDPAHFSKFFKKNEGMTARAFRKKLDLLGDR